MAAESFFNSRRAKSPTWQHATELPTAHGERDAVAAGSLTSYGADFADALHQAGVYTGNVLKGVKPADLPVVQATKFEFVINTQTARTLGIDVPPALLAIADKVIE